MQNSPPLTSLLPKEAALLNDFLITENRILRNNLGKRIQLTDTDRKELFRHGIPVRLPAGFEYPDDGAFTNREVVGDELLGGLLKHYHLDKAA